MEKRTVRQPSKKVGPAKGTTKRAVESKKTKNNQKTNSTKKSVNKNKKVKVTKKFCFTLGFVILFVLAIFLVSFLFTDARFKIKKLKVTGNKRYDLSVLNQEVVDIYNENIFKLSNKDILKCFKNYPYIYDVNLNKEFPDAVEINVVEREKYFVAFDKEKSEYIRLDKYGIILEKIDLASKEESEVVLFGINFSSEYEFGSYIEELELAKTNALNKIHECFNAHGVDKKITSAEFTKDNIIISLDYNINVIIKDNENLDYNVELLKSILKELEGKSGEIDMTMENPVFSEVK